MGVESKLTAEAAARFVLGLSHGWTAEDVKRAYRRLALVFHPDKNPGKSAEAATERFQAIAKAKDLLLGLSQGAGSAGSTKHPQGYKHDSGTHHGRTSYKTSQAPPPFPAPPPPFPPAPPRRFVPRERPGTQGKPAAPKMMAMWMCGACQLRDLGSETNGGTGRSVPCGRATAATRCFCGHTFEEHAALPGQTSDSEQRKLKCERVGCLCRDFSYVPIGALCTCGHDSTVHDAIPFHACSLPGCTCQTFHHAGMCACRHSWACHRTEIRTVTQTANTSRPAQPAWQGGGTSKEEAEASPASGGSSTPHESSPLRSKSTRPASAKASYAPYSGTPRSMPLRSRRPSSAGPTPLVANLNIRGQPISSSPQPPPGREGDLPAERSTTDKTGRAQPAATPSSNSKPSTPDCSGGTQPAATPPSGAKQSTTGTQPATTSSSKAKETKGNCTGMTQSAATSTSNAGTSKTEIPTNHSTTEASAATARSRTRPSSAPPSRSAAAAGTTGISSEASNQCNSSSARRSWTPQGLRPNGSGRSRPRPPFVRPSTAGAMSSSAPSSVRRPPLPTGPTGARARKPAWAAPSAPAAAEQPMFAAPPSTSMHETTTEGGSREASAEKTAEYENLKHNSYEEREVDESSSIEPDEEPDTEPGESTDLPSPTGEPRAATHNDLPTSDSRQRLWGSSSSSSFGRPAGAASEVAAAAAAAAAKAVSSDGRPWWERLHDPDKIHHSMRGPNRKPSVPPARRTTSQGSSHMSATEVLYAAAASARYPAAPRPRVRPPSAPPAFRSSRPSSAEREQHASARSGQDAGRERPAYQKSTNTACGRPAPLPSRNHSQEESLLFQESYIYEDEGPSLIPETDGPVFFGVDSDDEGHGGASSKNTAESAADLQRSALDPQSAWQEATLHRLSELRKTLGRI
eukprot:TRINITY_DN34604_c0_g1_i1.p1 TRINITY_DN34604_c0_g1~~TRINITY_DN34604_c0_g1_i1.p1  ORF type:complete len:915 (-),score=119.11 TRINITY_DN34604_c0_g1_i1:106-2850(-)